MHCPKRQRPGLGLGDSWDNHNILFISAWCSVSKKKKSNKTMHERLHGEVCGYQTAPFFLVMKMGRATQKHSAFLLKQKDIQRLDVSCQLERLAMSCRNQETGQPEQIHKNFKKVKWVLLMQVLHTFGTYLHHISFLESISKKMPWYILWHLPFRHQLLAYTALQTPTCLGLSPWTRFVLAIERESNSMKHMFSPLLLVRTS